MILQAVGIPPFDRNFAGVVKIGEWVRSQFFGISTTLGAVINPTFREAVQKVRGVSISFVCDDDIRSVSYCAKQKDGSYLIGIPPDFNHCHKRFALCKELCHILTDDSSVSAKGTSSQIRSALSSSKAVRSCGVELFTGPLSSEDFCFLLAAELMVPLNLRPIITRELTRGLALFDVARALRVPESVVIFMFTSAYLSYHDVVNGIGEPPSV